MEDFSACFPGWKGNFLLNQGPELRHGCFWGEVQRTTSKLVTHFWKPLWKGHSFLLIYWCCFYPLLVYLSVSIGQLRWFLWLQTLIHWFVGCREFEKLWSWCVGLYFLRVLIESSVLQYIHDLENLRDIISMSNLIQGVNVYARVY